jgi:hypothetical protein
MHPLISFSALLAEAQAYPFVSLAAQQCCLLRLERKSPGLLLPDSKRLSTELEDTLAPRAGGMSLHNLHSLRDQAWFPDESLAPEDDPKAPARSIALADYACHLAGLCLEFAGARVRLRSDGEPAAHAEHWRWLSLFLPSDFLVAAVSVSAGFVDPPNEHVQIVSPQLHAVLAEGCSETHLHVGSAVPFSTLWSGLMAAVPRLPRLSFAALHGPYPCAAANAVQLEVLVLTAAIARVVLAAFLWRRESRALSVSFADFVSGAAPQPTSPASSGETQATSHAPAEPDLLLPRLCDRVASRAGISQHKARKTCLAALRQVLFPRTVAQMREDWRAFYACLIDGPLANSSQAMRGADPMRADPMQSWLPVHSAKEASPESRFTCRGIHYLRSRAGRVDTRFAYLFFQYQRIRFAVYRYLAQTPGVSGLDWFSKHFRRIEPFRRPLQGVLLPIALELESQDLWLRSLEIRTTPDDTAAGVRGQLRKLAQGAISAYSTSMEPRAQPEVGMVFHFTKAREGRSSTGEYLHADPGTLVYGFRHARWFEERCQQARAIATALHENPELLILVRGIDAASHELAQPTWVLLPLWQIVRRASEQASARLAQRRPALQIPPLRTTIHAGEDFSRLAEGLRRIHETLEFGIVRMGDRIGHALALGIDPQHVASQAFEVSQALEDRLDDLLWEMSRYECGDVPAHAGRVEFVRAQIQALGTQQFGTDATVELLLRARVLRHQPGLVRRMGFPQPTSQALHPSVHQGAEKLLYRYLTDRSVFVRGQQRVRVRCDRAEVDFLQAAQRFLRTTLGRLEVTVESNPTSNLLIGGFHSLNSLPALRMSPLPEQTLGANLGPPVLLSVNTDNPITFSSCLADELAHVYYGLLRHGVTAASALTWIDNARIAGNRSKFTVPISRSLGVLKPLSRDLFKY